MLTDPAEGIQLFPWDRSITKRELVLRVCTANIVSSKHSLWPLHQKYLPWKGHPDFWVRGFREYMMGIKIVYPYYKIVSSH